MKGNLKKAFKEVLAPLNSFELNEQNDEILSEPTAGSAKEEHPNNTIDKPDSVPVEQRHKNSNDIRLSRETPLFMNNSSTAQTAQTTIITKDTIISGTITTDSNLIIAGVVNGDIESKNNVTASGKIFGDINCSSAEIISAEIEGNLNITDKLKIQSQSRVTGDLSANTIEISGDVKGNITALNSVQLSSNACVIGNITTASISIESGAFLQGNVNVQKDSD